MTPPALTHNQIATNLQRRLDDALERHAPSLLAAQRSGLGSGDYKPEPSGVFGNAQKRTRIPETDLFHVLLRQIERFEHGNRITDVAWTPLGIEGAVGSKQNLVRPIKCEAALGRGP